MIRRTVLIAATLTTSIATMSQAQSLPPLSKERYINDRLVAARVADRIRKTCPTLDARMIYAYTQARALKRYAEDKGYTNAQIEAFLDSKPDKQRIYATAEAYLAQNGAKKDDPQSFCRIGEAEIAAGSVAGSLLVAK